MSYKALIYCIFILLSVFALSGININGIFKTNKKAEAKIFMVLICMALGYLSAQFVIAFLEVSKII